jgi:hypothetical protein
MRVFGKPLLVHYHIYKNAGTSVDKNLSDSFGENWIAYEGSSDNFRFANEDIEAVVEANPGVRAISSHKAPPFPVLRRFVPILFLRHPIDRARSVYYFARRDPAQFDHELARDVTFKEYVNRWLDRPSSQIRNYQVIHLSRATSFSVSEDSSVVARSEDLCEAYDFLRSLRFFGLVGRFEESCRGFEACYGRTFPALKMGSARENALAEESLSEAAALELVRKELGQDTYVRLVDANRLDLALYDTALKLFDRNLARVSERRLRRARHALVDLFSGIAGGLQPMRRRGAKS